MIHRDSFWTNDGRIRRLVAAALCAVCLPAAGLYNESATVTGQVRFVDTQEPVQHAPVALIQTLTPDETPVAESETDAEGFYTLVAPPGSYILQVQNPPEPDLQDLRPAAGATKDHLTNVLSRKFITLNPGELLEFDIDDAGDDPVGQWGSIVGVVTNTQTGQPVSGVQVNLSPSAGLAPAVTDGFGVYAFPVVQLGTYQGTAGAAGFQEGGGTANLANSFQIVQMNFSLAPLGGADVNGDGVVNAVDVQLVINTALGMSPDCACDVNGDGVVNAVDVQLVINAALSAGSR